MASTRPMVATARGTEMKNEEYDPQTKNGRRQVAAAVIGNALEWYDFVVFGFLTVVIARLFFPQSNSYSGLLLATATYGIGYISRPIGGVVLGAYADQH